MNYQADDTSGMSNIFLLSMFVNMAYMTNLKPDVLAMQAIKMCKMNLIFSHKQTFVGFSTIIYGPVDPTPSFPLAFGW